MKVECEIWDMKAGEINAVKIQEKIFNIMLEKKENNQNNTNMLQNLVVKRRNEEEKRRGIKIDTTGGNSIYKKPFDKILKHLETNKSIQVTDIRKIIRPFYEGLRDSSIKTIATSYRRYLEGYLKKNSGWENVR